MKAMGADHDVYVMYSNTDEFLKDTGILLESAADYTNDAYNGFLVNSVPVTDNNTNLTQAYFVEYNVQGFGSDLAGGGALVLGAMTTPATGSNNNSAYVGAVSFVSVPEPSTYAMMGLGLLALIGIRRFRQLS